jgi:hypothetical protein
MTAQRAGELLHEMEKKGEITGHGGDRKSKSSQPTLIPDVHKPKPKTLPELGITRDQSSQWKELAEVSQDFLTATVTVTRSTPGKF